MGVFTTQGTQIFLAEEGLPEDNVFGNKGGV